MVDGMKKLVEKYKRELMEYNRSSSSEKPSPLHFPEMIAYSPKEGGADNNMMIQAVKKETHETAESPAMKPKPEPVMPIMETVTNVPRQGASAQVPQQAPMPQTPRTAIHAPQQLVLPPQAKGFVQNNDGVMRGDFKAMLSEPENNANKTPSGSENIRDSFTESSNRLSETPVGSQSTDEQLDRRDFENTPETRNPRSDIKPLETQTNGTREMQPEREYADLQDFYNTNNRRGTLRFRVYTAHEALPVTGANIEVTKVIGNKKHTFYKLTTDISGNTSTVYLPAPPSELSQQPENTIQPYALYDVYITADNFRDVSIKNLPIFDGILSGQSIAMIPMAGGGTPRQITENGPGVNGGVY